MMTIVPLSEKFGIEIGTEHISVSCTLTNNWYIRLAMVYLPDVKSSDR